MTYDPAEIREAQEYFGFARPVLIEKDWHIIRAMRAIDNPLEETRRALAALEAEDVYASRYTEFVRLMVYGEKPPFVDAMQTVGSLTKQLLGWFSQSTG